MTTETPRNYFDTSSEAQRARALRGRKVGSRAKLAKRFFEDTYAAWEEQGPSVLARAAFHDPVAFANMVARLMPQKIEVSTPTDGMSDERLSELLDFAERMAGLKAEQAKVLQGEVIDATCVPVLAHNPIIENGDVLGGAETRGEGALRKEGGAGEKTTSTLRAAPAGSTGKTANALNKQRPSVAKKLPAKKQVAKKLQTEVAKKLQAEEPVAKMLLPYPVGKPHAATDAKIERLNRAAMDEQDIDPESLF